MEKLVCPAIGGAFGIHRSASGRVLLAFELFVTIAVQKRRLAL
jgi:hypothetical protein